MESFSDHLRAEEDVQFSHAKISENAAEIVLSFEGIRIHAVNASMREEFGQGFLDALGAQTGVFDLWIATTRLRAHGRHSFLVAADMATELLILAMIGEGDAAVRAASDKTAARALKRSRVAAAIKKENDLLLPFEPLRDAFVKLWGKDRDELVLAQGLAHVDHADDGHFFVIGPLGHFEQRVLLFERIVIAFQRRSGGSEDNDGSFHAAAHNGHVPSVISRGFLLLVGVLVFFVDDDQTQRLDRSEDRRARADSDTGASLANFVPFIMALARGKMAVKNGDQGTQRAGAEARFEAFDRLGSQ